MVRRSLKSLIALSVIGTMLIGGSITASAVIRVDGNQKVSQAQNVKRNIGYYCDWAVYEGEGYTFPNQLPAEYLTHLNVAFTGVEKDGSLIMLDKDANFGHPLKGGGKDGADGDKITYGDINGGIVNELRTIRHRNPNLKLGFSVGGWSMSGNFTHVARSAAGRAKFAKEVAQLLDYTNFDFIDIDWEYPASVREPDKVDNKHDQGNPDAIPEDKENYVLMLQEIRNELDKLSKKTNKDYEISIAINMSHEKTEIGIDVPKIFDVIDFANVMTYDAAGAWDSKSGHQSALYENPHSDYAGKGFSIDSSIKNFLKLGAPANKLVVGAAFYTRGWEKVNNDGPDASLPGLYGTAEKVNKDVDQTPGYGAKNDKPNKVGDGGRNAGNWAWRNRDLLMAAYPGMTEYWDDTAKAPYLYSKETGSFFTYDNKRSIAEKCDYVNEHDLGGIITWTVSNDKVTASGKNDDLTKAIYDGLYGDSKLPEHEIIDQKSDASVKLSTSAEAWGSTGLLNIALKNEAKLESNGSLMVRTAEEACDTLMHTKLYIKTNGSVKITGAKELAGGVKQENGYYVVDLGTKYDSKLIKPGETKNLQLIIDQKVNNYDFVQEIYMTQRTRDHAEELKKTVLYTSNVEYAPEDVNKDGKIDSLDVAELAQRYNAKKGQKGYDVAYDLNKDNIIDIYDLSKVASKIEASNNGGDNGSDGDNEDNNGDNGESSVPAWDANKTYKKGEKCSYNGVIYQAGWETKGEIPGSNQWGAWKPVK